MEVETVGILGAPQCFPVQGIMYYTAAGVCFHKFIM